MQAVPVADIEMAPVGTGSKQKGYELVEAVQGEKDVEIGTVDYCPPDISWVNLNFRAGKSQILNNVWGKVGSGQICAIMGPSKRIYFSN
jgi:ABC-type multidrug transport system fused ATPase/permease subunit